MWGRGGALSPRTPAGPAPRRAHGRKLHGGAVRQGSGGAQTAIAHATASLRTGAQAAQQAAAAALTAVLVHRSIDPHQPLARPGRSQQAPRNGDERHKGGGCALPLVRHKGVRRVTAGGAGGAWAVEQSAGARVQGSGHGSHPQAHLPTRLGVGAATKKPFHWGSGSGSGRGRGMPMASCTPAPWRLVQGGTLQRSLCVV